jgi:propanol-preferring alcohol dehydrogenase
MFAPQSLFWMVGLVSDHTRISAHQITGISPGVAAVATDAVTTAYHGIVRRAEVKKHETTFLFGLGGLGFNALQIVRSIGARVIVSDLRQEKLDAALKLGVLPTDIVPVGKSVQDFIQESDLQGKIDTVLEFVGKHQTFQDALHIGTCGIINSSPVAYISEF